MAQANIKAVITADDRASAKLGAFGGSFTKLAGAMAVGQLAAMAFAKAVKMITDNVDNAIKRVDTLNNFPRVMQNLGYSTADASIEIKRLEEGVKGLPTSLDSIASAMQNIAPSSKSLSEATDLTLALNNAVLAGGKSAELQATAMEQFSQAISKGKPDMVEWRSLAVAMPGQLDQIAQSLGYGRGEWQKMATDVSEGTLKFDKVKEAIMKLNKDGLGQLPSFAEQAKAATGGIDTSIANMKTSITRGIANIIQAIGTDKLTNVITNVGKAFEGVLNIVTLLITGDFKKGIFGLQEDDPFISALFRLRELLITTFNFLRDTGLAVLTAFKQAWDFLYPSIEALWNTIATQLWPAMQRWYEEVLKPLVPIIGVVLVGALWVFINALNIFLKVISSVMEAISSLTSFFRGDFANGVTGAFGWVVEKLMWLKDNFWETIGFIIGWFATLPVKLPMYMFQAIAAVIGLIMKIDWGAVFKFMVDAWINGWKLMINAALGLYNTIRNLDWGAIARSIGNGIVGLLEGAINGAMSGLPGAPKIKIPRFADGVQNFGGGLAVVGERGAELVHLPKGSSVIPNHEIGGVGGTTVNISLSGVFMGTPGEARKLAQMVAENLKTVANQKNMSVMEMLT